MKMNKQLRNLIKKNKALEKIFRIPYNLIKKIKFSFLTYIVKILGINNGKKRLKLLSDKTANDLIKKMINSEKPFMIGRYGGTEFSTLFKLKNEDDAIEELNRLSGFFPKDKQLLPKFKKIYAESARQVDVLAIWLYKYYFNKKKEVIVSLPNINALISLESLNTYKNNWTQSLVGKRVLIIHPFKKTIEYQYKNKKQIKIIPNFKSLKVIQAVQSSRGEKIKFKDWFEALEYIKKQINKNKNNFDIALIGCGAYGFPLAAHVKKIGKQAIHIGGTLQLLFGIKGRRWEEVEKINFPKNWIYPLLEDTPKKLKEIKDGNSYW